MIKNNINNWKVALYIRLSVEDEDAKEESNSVVNQKQLLSQYISENEDFDLVDYYIDDGYSGTNFNRPGFKRMMTDIFDKKVNAVIIKDLSRLGRNYIEVGNYIEQIFPVYNVRFISINDNIDSFKDPDSTNNILVPFKNLMNDEYSRDISNKVKAVMKMKKKNGEFVGTIAPYGYIKSPEDKHKLIVDRESAEVVKLIYKMTLEGTGRNKIAKMLNETGVLSPIEYKKKVLNVKCGNRYTNCKEKNLWNSTQITNILKNEVYCGDMVQGKERRISYKIKKSVKLPKEDWIRVKDTHEAIVSREDFEKVQNLIFSKDIRVCKNGDLNIFSGHLKCADCGMTMTAVTRKLSKKHLNDGKKLYYYMCTTYSRKSHSLCTKHTIKSEALENLCLKAIKMHIALIIDVEKVIKEIKMTKNINCESELLKNNIETINKEIEKIKTLKKDLYEDWKFGFITKGEYLQYNDDYSSKYEELNTNLNNAKTRYEIINNRAVLSDEIKWIQEIKKYKNIQTLTKEVIDNLIDTIYIKEDNNNLNIKFKYQDEYLQVIQFIKDNGKYESLNILKAV